MSNNTSLRTYFEKLPVSYILLKIKIIQNNNNPQNIYIYIYIYTTKL